MGLAKTTKIAIFLLAHGAENKSKNQK